MTQDEQQDGRSQSFSGLGDLVPIEMLLTSGVWRAWSLVLCPPLVLTAPCEVRWLHLMLLRAAASSAIGYHVYHRL